MKRIERAIAVVFSARGDTSYPESEEELEQVINFLQTTAAVLVFRKHKEYPYVKPKPASPGPVRLP